MTYPTVKVASDLNSLTDVNAPSPSDQQVLAWINASSEWQPITLDYEPADPDIQNHISDVSTNPHVVTKTQVGLGNVDNTSDLLKPISNDTQTALDGKASSAQGSLADSSVQPADNISVLTNNSQFVTSLTSSDPGSDRIVNTVSLTQAEYDALTPVATTFYVIVG